MAPFHAPNTAQECISRNLMVFIDRIFCVVECVTEAFIHGKHLVEKRFGWEKGSFCHHFIYYFEWHLDFERKDLFNVQNL